MINLEDRIEINPNILTGKPVIRNTRIPVELIVKLVAQSWTYNKIIKEYPSLIADDIKAALLYAEKLVENEAVYPVISSKV
jgi:uncharacterized protein (DUF433 family)